MTIKDASLRAIERVWDCGKRIGPNGRAVHHWDVPRRPAGMLF